MIIARYSSHIESDLKRNWSSWNFGEEGFKGTKQDLDQALTQITETMPLWISGFDIYPDKKEEFTFGELYPNYWVAIDTRGSGLCCHILDSDTLSSALVEVRENKGKFDGTGDGDFVDCSEAKVIFSEDPNGFGLHLLEIED